MTFARKPGSAAMARLLKTAAATFGVPKYVITDLGGEFAGRVFQGTVTRLGAKPRFASAENIHATARLERFWKTLKGLAHVRLLPPLHLGDLERRLADALFYYSFLRPHSALGCRTPVQTFLGEPATALRRLPRGRRGEPCLPSPRRIALMETDWGGLPVLAPLAA